MLSQSMNKDMVVTEILQKLWWLYFIGYALDYWVYVNINWANNSVEKLCEYLSHHIG